MRSGEHDLLPSREVRLILIGLLWLGLGMRSTSAWEFTIGDGDPKCAHLRSLHLDRNDDAIGFGFRQFDCYGDGIGPNFLVKLAGDTGAERWQRGAPDLPLARVLGVDDHGDLLIETAEHLGFETWVTGVGKLAGDTGATAWWRPGVAGQALDACGDVLAQDGADLVTLAGDDGSERARVPFPTDGRVAGLLSNGDLLVEELSLDSFSKVITRLSRYERATGAELWSQYLPASPDQSLSVHGYAQQPGGGIVAFAENVQGYWLRDWVALVLDEESGAVRWHTTVPWGAEVRAGAVDREGNLFLAGNVVNPRSVHDFAIAKLSGADGSSLWQWSVDGDFDDGTVVGDWDSAAALALTPDGDVVVTGTIANPGTWRDLTVMRISGSTGAVRWRRDLDFPRFGVDSRADYGLVAAVDGAGDVVVGGKTRDGGNAPAFTIVKLSGATGADFPCGNGQLDANEACDDGNTTSLDGCDIDCTPSEQCDDAGLLGQACIYANDYPPPSCVGIEVPRRVAAAFDRIGSLLRAAEGSDSQTVIERTRERLARTVRRAGDRAARAIRRGGLDPACGDSLLGLVTDLIARGA